MIEQNKQSILHENDTKNWLENIGIESLINWNPSDMWARNDSDEILTAPLGMDEQGHVVNISFGRDAGSAHGIIQGETGSGKSVSLNTILLGLAAKYSPERVKFVYAYSGFPNPLIELLPHTSKTFDLNDSMKNTVDLTNLYNDLTQKRINEKIQNRYTRKAQDPVRPTVIFVTEGVGGVTEVNLIKHMIRNLVRHGRELDMHALTVDFVVSPVGGLVMGNAGWVLDFSSAAPYDDVPYFLRNLDRCREAVLSHGHAGNGPQLEAFYLTDMKHEDYCVDKIIATMRSAVA